MKILGIESSCDETAAAVVENGREVLSNVIATSLEEHKLYGGVVPEIASRRHAESISGVVEEALKQADCTMNDIDAVAVTYAPGLIGSLLVGVSFAKGLSQATNTPLVPVHHLRGHIASNYISCDIEPPFLCLVVSGGHSHIVAVKSYTDFEVIGKTRDDAAGEALDKAGRTMGLEYPGGISIDKLSPSGDENAFSFPHPRIHDAPYDYSFSGLKTAVLNYIHNNKDASINDIAASFQYTAVNELVAKTVSAAKRFGYKKIAAAGGVAANKLLRETLRRQSELNGMRLYVPDFVYCTDNAAMAACAAYYKLKNGKYDDLSMNANPSLEIGQV